MHHAFVTPVTPGAGDTDDCSYTPAPLCLRLPRKVYVLFRNFAGAHRLTVFHSSNSHTLNLDQNAFLQQARFSFESSETLLSFLVKPVISSQVRH